MSKYKTQTDSIQKAMIIAVILAMSASCSKKVATQNVQTGAVPGVGTLTQPSIMGMTGSQIRVPLTAAASGVMGSGQVQIQMPQMPLINPKQEISRSIASLPAAPTSPASNSIQANLPAADSKKSEESKKPEQKCFTLTYHHQSSAGHSSAESCSHHKNIIKLNAPEGVTINPKSVCVRANGIPVRFQVIAKKGASKGASQGELKNTQLLLGAVAGPKTKISATFCVNQNQCQENCVVPKDEFMDAIGGDADDLNTVAAAQWDPDSNEKDPDVNAAMSDELLKEMSHDSDLKVYEDWVSETAVPSCFQKKSS